MIKKIKIILLIAITKKRSPTLVGFSFIKIKTHMTITENIDNINYITLNDYEYTTSYWICKTLNISYDRLKKWREGRVMKMT